MTVDFEVEPEAPDVAEARQRIENARRPRADATDRSYFVQSAEDLFNQPPMNWLIKGLLPESGLGVLYGASGSGKSFLSLDLGAAIAGSSISWFDHRIVRNVSVTIVALEGAAGLSKRLQAWAGYHKRTIPKQLQFIVAQPFNLTQPSQVEALAKAINNAGRGNGLLIVDTLNRASEGCDENSAVDMGKIIAAMEQLQRLIGGLVVAVHHAGKDLGKGMRGHSSLRAACDVVLEVTYANGQRDLKLEKIKDGREGDSFPFRLESIDLQIDKDGDVITSCVIEREEARTACIKRQPRGTNQKIASNALGDSFRNSKNFDKGGAPKGCPCIELETAVRIVAEHLTSAPNKRTNVARNVIAAMVANGFYGAGGDWLWRN